MSANNRADAVKKSIFWGIVSLAAYLIVFLNQQVVMHYTTLGGSYAIVVIAMAFAFSFIHGAFANYLVEALGFKAASKGGH